MKQTHDIEISEKLPTITEKLDEVLETTKQLGELVKKSDVENENFRTPATQIITGTQSLRDTLSFMKRTKMFQINVKKIMVMYFGIKFLTKHYEKK